MPFNKKAKKHLGYSPNIKIDDGLRRTLIIPKIEVYENINNWTGYVGLVTEYALELGHSYLCR